MANGSPTRTQPAALGTNVQELMPGDVATGFAGDQLKTLLGSCVSVILTDPRRTVAAMCHIVHVGQPNAANQNNTAYGAVALADMYTRLTALGVMPARCEAYVYGGGNMFPGLYMKRHVGQNNIDWALDFLHSEGIAIIGYNLGGNGYRKLSWTVGASDPVVEAVFSAQGPNYGN